MAVLPDVWYFWVQFVESDGYFGRNLFGELDVCIGVQEQRDHEVFGMRDVDQIFFVVVIGSSDFRVRFSLIISQVLSADCSGPDL